jgi:general secretion pathway protein K
MIRRSLARQTGVALITALLVIALVTAAAVAMAARQQLDIRRTANTLTRDQAYVFASGAAVMAGAVLAKDDAKVDHWEEDWAMQQPAIPFEGGVLAGGIEDLQGRFNLNNLVSNGKRSNFDVERFKRLLQVLKEKSEPREIWENAEPADLANAVADWIDSDSEPVPGGGEDTDYLQGERPYRTANALLTSTSELLLVRGFSAPIYNQLAPYITVLPERTKLNVNTAKEDVLRAYAEDASCIDVAKLARPEPRTAGAAATAEAAATAKTIYNKVDDFWSSNAIAGCLLVGIKKNKDNKPPETPAPGQGQQGGQTGQGTPAPAANSDPADSGKLDPDQVFTVNSGYFQVAAYSEVGPDDHRARVKLYTTLRRADGKLATIGRMQGFE